MRQGFKALWRSAYRHKWLILLCLASLALRLYKLDAIPYGLNVDEAGSAYDAWCIANYGIDRFGMGYPLFFLNYGGGGQSPLFTYLCALSIKLFGMSPYTIRLPAVFSSMLTLLFGLKIIRRIWEDEKPLLLYAFFFLIMPYFNMAARFGLDCNLMLGFSTMFLSSFLRATDTGRLRDFALCGALGGLTLCTYTLSYIALPLFLLLMLIILLAFHKIHWKQILCFFAGLLPLALPLIAMIIINQFQMETLVIGPFTIPRLTGNRASEFALPSFQRFFEALYAVYVKDGTPFNSLPFYWTMYYVSPLLAVFGFGATLRRVIHALRARAFTAEMAIVGWSLAILLTGSMLDSGVSCARMNGFYFAALYFVVSGAVQWLSWARKAALKSLQYISRAFCIVCAVFYLFFGCHFLTFYFSQEKEQMSLFAPVPTEAFAYVMEDDMLEGRDIYYFCNDPCSYIFYLLSTLPNPATLELSVDAPNDIPQIGNVYFDIPNEIDENSIYILREDNAYWETLVGWNFTLVPVGDHNVFYVE